MEMIKMKYGMFDKSSTLCRGELNGFPFVIVNNEGWIPCAYMDITKAVDGLSKEFGIKNLDTELTFEKYEELNRTGVFNSIHYGITYYNETIPAHHGIDDKGLWIGWDYGHLGDFTYPLGSACVFSKKLKRWTTEEIYDECVALSNNLKRYQNEKSDN